MSVCQSCDINDTLLSSLKLIPCFHFSLIGLAQVVCYSSWCVCVCACADLCVKGIKFCIIYRLCSFTSALCIFRRCGTTDM